MTRSDRRECGSCKVHFSPQLHACPNCGEARGQSVAPKRRFSPAQPTQPRA